MKNDNEDTLFDLQDKKLKRSDRLLRVFEDIHDHIYANDGLSTQEAFIEVIKVLFVKIYDEKNNKNSRFYIKPDEYEALAHGKLNKDFRQRSEALMSAAFESFPDVFDKDEEVKVKDSTLAFIVTKLQDINLSESSGDIKGLAFQKFLRSSQRADRGQFFTPEQVVRLCVEIIQPKKDEKVIDPTCGSGGFLSQAMRHVFQNSLSDASIKEIRAYIENNIFGIEINKMVAKVAKMRLLLEGDGSPNLANIDSLASWEELSFQKQKAPHGEGLLNYFDVILTNPPFGSQGKIVNKTILREYDLGYKWNKFNGKYIRSAEFQNGQVSDILFLERNLAFLKPGGRMAIVLPDGIFENPSLEYVREYILDKANVMAIIKLPFETFVPFGTGVKVSLLFLQKKSGKVDEKAGDVFFGIVEKIGYKGNKNGTPVYKLDAAGGQLLNPNGEPIIDEDITSLLEHYREFKQSKRKLSEPNCFTLPHAKIESRFDFDYYKPSFRLLEESLLNKGARRFADVLEIVKTRSEKLRQKDVLVRYVELADVNVDYSEISSASEMYVHELPSRAAFEIKKGDIITAIAGNSIGTRGHMSALVTERYSGAICTNGFRILRPKSELNPYYLLYYLRSDFFLKQVYKLRTGAAIPSISDTDLLNILIFIPDKEMQDSIANRMRKSFDLREDSKQIMEGIELQLV